MATVQNNATNLQCSTAAAIQSWASVFRNTFLAGNWVQTADTGQTNANALPAVTVSNTVGGYEIWRMNDTLQQTAPVFAKIEYGTGGNGGFIPAVWITVGTGSDGAGNITGILRARVQVTGGSSGAPPTSTPAYGSAGPSYFVVALATSGVGRMLVSIERNKSPQGSDTSDAILVFAEASSGATALRQVVNDFIPFVGTVPTVNTTPLWLVTSAASWALGNAVGTCPLRYSNGGISNPSLNLACYIDGDLARRVPIVMNIYGANHTYLPIGGDNITAAASGNTNSSVMMRFE